MLIQAHQLEALGQSHYVEFEARTAKWLGEQFPDDCHLLGPNAVRERIRYALQNGFRYEFYTEADAARYVYLCFLLGRNFDLAPEYDWLRGILSGAGQEPSARLDAAYNELASRLEREEGQMAL